MLTHSIVSEIELKNLATKIAEFYENEKLTDVQKEIVQIKYIDLKKDINVRKIASSHSTSIKAVTRDIEKVDNMLFTYLKKFI